MFDELLVDGDLGGRKLAEKMLSILATNGFLKLIEKVVISSIKKQFFLFFSAYSSSF